MSIISDDAFARYEAEYERVLLMEKAYEMWGSEHERAARRSAIGMAVAEVLLHQSESTESTSGAGQASLMLEAGANERAIASAERMRAREPTGSPSAELGRSDALADELIALHAAATPMEWELYTSNSWRRVGMKHEYKAVIEPVTLRDGHPDLSGKNLHNDMSLLLWLRNHVPQILAALRGSPSATASLWSIRHVDGRWRTMDTLGMPDWTDDADKALAFRLREHADTFAADDPDDVRIVAWSTS